MKKYILTISVLFISVIGFTQNDTFFEKADMFFSSHVKNGRVAYKSIKSSPDSLNDLLDLAAELKVSPENKSEYQAFWINVYNLAVIKGVIDNFPIKSPLDVPGFFDKTKYNLGGKQITLNDIENKQLRARFKDARFHFVLVCGAVGCPPIISMAYTPTRLEVQLTEQTVKALNGNFLKINSKKKKVEGSEILKWYKEDFVQQGSELDFINKYRKEKIPENYKLVYFPYNWKLNSL